MDLPTYVIDRRQKKIKSFVNFVLYLHSICWIMVNISNRLRLLCQAPIFDVNKISNIAILLHSLVEINYGRMYLSTLRLWLCVPVTDLYIMLYMNMATLTTLSGIPTGGLLMSSYRLFLISNGKSEGRNKNNIFENTLCACRYEKCRISRQTGQRHVICWSVYLHSNWA